MRRRQVHLFCLIVVRLACLTCSAGVVAWAGPALAQSPAPPHVAASSAAQRVSASAERDRLRAELARVQSDIDRLKTGERGLRADYLLRGRLADAEALARRLTELDAQLGPRPDAAAAAARAPATPPQSARDEAVPSPTDGPAELEAKADILTDQARRAQSQAIVLQGRIDQVRGRRELRRRVHQLENDPFAPLESSHRRLAAGGGANAAASTASHDSGGPPRTIVNSPAAPAPGPLGVTVTPGAGAAAAGSGTQGTGAQGTGAQGTGTSTTSTPAVQVRDVLDPSTTAQVRRTDPGLAPANDLASMEQALAALNARAQQLDAQAKRLRAQARAR
jgi:hypothetical protein